MAGAMHRDATADLLKMEEDDLDDEMDETEESLKVDVSEAEHKEVAVFSEGLQDNDFLFEDDEEDDDEEEEDGDLSDLPLSKPVKSGEDVFPCSSCSALFTMRRDRR